MSWLRIDDQYPDHPKIAMCGPLAGMLDIAAMAYCSKHLTDGFVPEAAVHMLINLAGIAVGGKPVTHEDLVGALTSAHGPLGPRWTVVDGGYHIHDYLDYNPSRAEVETQRAATAARVRRHRRPDPRPETVEGCNGNVTALHGRYAGVGNAGCNGRCNAAPHPLPQREEKEASSTLSPTQKQLSTIGDNSAAQARASPTYGWDDPEMQEALASAVASARAACPADWVRLEQLLARWRRERKPLEVCIRCLEHVARYKPPKAVGYAIRIMAIEEGTWHADRQTAALAAEREAEKREVAPPTIEIRNRAPTHVCTGVQAMVARLIETAKDQGRICPEKAVR